MYDSTEKGGEEDRSVSGLQPELCYLDTDATGQEDKQNPKRWFFQTWMITLVPEVSPFPWTIINNVFAVSGCLLIADLWYTNSDYGDPEEERPFATAFFLSWEFSICAFWMLETGLSASYQHSYLRQPLKWYTKLEMVIAVYFVGTTFRMLWQWDLLQYDEDRIWEIPVDTSFYVYLALRNWQRTSQPSELLSIHASEPANSSSVLGAPGEEDHPESYRIMTKDVGT